MIRRPFPRALVLVLVVALAVPAEAQTPATPATPAPPAAPTTAPMLPIAPLPAPTAIRPFPTPQELVGRELTIEEAVNIAMENAPKIVARIGDYVAAQQRVNQALAPMLPQLTGSGAWGRGRAISPATGIHAIGDFGNASATASQLIWDFGRTWAAKDAAKASAEVVKESLEAQKLDISQLVKTQYFTLLLAKRLVEVNVAALDRAAVNLRSAQGFFQVGTQPKSFVTRAEVDVANARVDVIRAQNAVNLSRVALNTAMGIAVNAPTEVKDILAYQQFPMRREDLVAEAIRSRPEYRGAKAQADAADATVRQTFRDFFPNLVGSGTYGITGTTGAPALSTGGNRTTTGFADSGNEWQIGLSLNWSIFDGGGKVSRYKEAKANLEAAQARVRDTELSVWQSVEQSYLNLSAAAERIGAAQKAVESAEENYQLARGRFDAGVANIIELTDAQLALTQAQSTYATTLADYRVSIAALERALGRR
jgi:outer membrane protein TolC